MAFYRLNTAELTDAVHILKPGDQVELSGVVYTARDAAHKKLFALLDEGKPLPFPLENAVIYYAGPTATPPGRVIGSCGPTTSGRMDPFTPRLMELGLLATIGKGERDEKVRQAIAKRRGLYFCALGGVGALAAQCVKSCRVVGFEELSCESVKQLEIERFPLYVGIDARGNVWGAAGCKADV